jgi:membrane protease YdiL (CAAX protease family)
LLLLGAIPALIVTCLFRESLADYGVCGGDLRKAAWVLLILLPVCLVAAYVGTRDPRLREFYPLNPSADRAFALHSILFLCFYAGWEFHFRGFLQNGLRASLGDANAILVQTMASTLLHIGTPTVETYMAIIAGIVWGVIMYWTRSLLAGLILHFSLGIFADYFLLFYGN